MRTKTIELNPSQVKIKYLDKDGKEAKDDCYTNLFSVELTGCDIDTNLIMKVKFPELDYGADPVDGCVPLAKVKVTYLEPTSRESKYMSRMKNWISNK